MINIRTPIREGFAIFIPTLCQGTIPACYDETDYPVVFPTEREAQHEIVDNLMIRLRQFIDDEREFDDAISTDEFVLPVDVWPDGTISIEDGRIFGKCS